MGPRLAGSREPLRRHASRNHAQRLLHGQHARNVEYAGHQHRGHNHGLLCRFGRHGHRLPDRPENPRRTLLEGPAACRSGAAVFVELGLRPFAECRHADHLQLFHRFPEGLSDALVYPANQKGLQSQGRPQRVLRLFLSVGFRVRTAFDDHHRQAGLSVRLEVHVLLHDASAAPGAARRGGLFPARPPQPPYSAAGAARPDC